MQDNEIYQLLTVRRDYNGVESRGQYRGKEILVKTQFKVKENDFIISKRQISFGACGLVPKHLDNAIVSNEYNVFIPQRGIDIFFFNYLMQLPRAQNLFFLMSDGVHIEKMLFKTKDWLKQSIAIPSTISEQKKIVEILTNCDEIIDLKKKLIVDMESRKKWLMQNLLTGKVRLKGFTNEWKQVTLGNIFKERTEINCGNLQLLAITSSKGVIPRKELTLKDNSNDDKRKYKKICVGDLGYNTMRMWQGVCALSNYEGIVSPAYTILQPVDKIDAKFLLIYLRLLQLLFFFIDFHKDWLMIQEI
ncbi:restriction endonuclease subunit S [Clostridium botulinum]|nr:restriction endonuclease subunit S [Clostridium botulinum]